MDNSKFCRFFNHGLVYNNDSTSFTISPCCYFKTKNKLDPAKPIESQYLEHHAKWLKLSVENNCQICISQEKNNISSFRLASNDIIDIDADGIQMLTIAVNKQCNLACATCGSHSSSFWFQENKRNNVKENPSIIALHQEDRNKETTKKFLSIFDSTKFNNLKYIKFGGGEPFMSDTHYEILSLLKNRQNITLQYTSNFSIMPKNEVFEIWKEFKLVKWMASVDGVGDQFEFLRWPHKWSNFENFTKTALQSVPDNVVFGIEHTLNPLNIFYFDLMENWFNKNFGKNRLGDPSDFNIHHADGIMSIKYIPQEIIDMIYKKYGHDHRITYCLPKQGNSSNHNMITYLDKLDSWRDLNWRQTFHDVSKFIV